MRSNLKIWAFLNLDPCTLVEADRRSILAAVRTSFRIHPAYKASDSSCHTISGRRIPVQLSVIWRCIIYYVVLSSEAFRSCMRLPALRRQVEKTRFDTVGLMKWFCISNKSAIPKEFIENIISICQNITELVFCIWSVSCRRQPIVPSAVFLSPSRQIQARTRSCFPHIILRLRSTCAFKKASLNKEAMLSSTP